MVPDIFTRMHRFHTSTAKKTDSSSSGCTIMLLSTPPRLAPPLWERPPIQGGKDDNIRHKARQRRRKQTTTVLAISLVAIVPKLILILQLVYWMAGWSAASAFVFPSASSSSSSSSSKLGILHSFRRHPCRSTVNFSSSLLLSSSAANGSSGDAQNDDDDDLWTLQDLEEYAVEEGVMLSFSTLGPGYRSVARTKGLTVNDNKKNNGNHDDETDENDQLVLGYVEGFQRPAGTILHLDKMEVFQPILQRARRQFAASQSLKRQDGSGNGNGDGGDLSGSDSILYLGGISFGVGLLMGYQCLLHGRQQGCTTAEFLAIDDAPQQHRRLVRYYQRVGFQVIRYVGDDWRHVPDRLVWGGCGTLMREELDVLIPKWSRLLTIMRNRSKEKRGQSTTEATALQRQNETMTTTKAGQ